MPVDAALIDDVSADAVRWAAAMREVAQIRAQELEDRKELMSWFNMIWCEWTNWRDEPFDTPDGALLSIPDFIAAGLTRDELRELVVVAMRSQASDKWRYFCGCCWKRIKQNQELASQIVNGSQANDIALLQFSTCWTRREIDEIIDRGVELLSEHHGTTYTRDVLSRACKQHGPNCDDILCHLCTATTLIASYLLEDAATEG